MCLVPIQTLTPDALLAHPPTGLCLLHLRPRGSANPTPASTARHISCRHPPPLSFLPSQFQTSYSPTQSAINSHYPRLTLATVSPRLPLPAHTPTASSPYDNYPNLEPPLWVRILVLHTTLKRGSPWALGKFPLPKLIATARSNRLATARPGSPPIRPISDSSLPSPASFPTTYGQGRLFRLMSCLDPRLYVILPLASIGDNR
ncbi:hypothetical protein L227DRAFT_184965 [Lentinus tigrinus ALCF2SS1-6]|uniref:Uncharacterized protein n=1 Tax=Lentinus tigrinus ALCF2SS1-6 TaxID=1328759 RepID=A0A5C2S547_9APHY|nr:hypothetical protein L227DRAFT_184965 [Lentinus tigrinus ALCF2SS1-6]